MIPYFLLIIIPAIFGFVMVKRSENGALRMYIGSGPDMYRNNMMIPVFFIMLFILLAVRDKSIGRDLGTYEYFFNSFGNQSLEQLIKIEPEVLYRVLNWVVYRITDNYQWFLAVVAALTVYPTATLYAGDRRNGYLKVILFVNMSTFIMLFSGLRQSIAMSIGMLAYRAVRQKRIVLFLVLVLIAFGVHHSAFMILFMYPLYHIRLKKNHAWFILPVLLFVFLNNQRIFSMVTTWLATYLGKYEAEMESTGAYTMLFLFVLFAIFSFVIPDENRMDGEMFGLRNFMLFSVALQCFAPLYATAMRMNYYYILFVPILIPKVIAVAKPRYKQVARLANFVMSAFFTVYFAITTYESYVTGISTLDTIPYVPFWRG